MPISCECALAQYATHVITKMNANFGFGPHTPGLGRQPASDQEASRYFEQLGKALVAAIQRDFDEPDRKFGVRRQRAASKPSARRRQRAASPPPARPASDALDVRCRRASRA